VFEVGRIGLQRGAASGTDNLEGDRIPEHQRMMGCPLDGYVQFSAARLRIAHGPKAGGWLPGQQAAVIQERGDADQ
jgi:hypothetical protein